MNFTIWILYFSPSSTFGTTLSLYVFEIKKKLPTIHSIFISFIRKFILNVFSIPFSLSSLLLRSVIAQNEKILIFFIRKRIITWINWNRAKVSIKARMNKHHNTYTLHIYLFIGLTYSKANWKHKTSKNGA